jgi:hypothetical protein
MLTVSGIVTLEKMSGLMLIMQLSGITKLVGRDS